MKITIRLLLIVVCILITSSALDAQPPTPTPEVRAFDLLFSVDATVPGVGAALQDSMNFLIRQLEQANLDWRIAVVAVDGDTVTNVLSYSSDQERVTSAFGRIGTDDEAQAESADFVVRPQATTLEIVFTSKPNPDLIPTASTPLCLIGLNGAVFNRLVLEKLTSCPEVFNASSFFEIQFDIPKAIERATDIELPHSVAPTTCNERNNPNIKVRVFAASYDIFCEELVRDGADVAYGFAVPGEIPNESVVARKVLQAYQFLAITNDYTDTFIHEFDPPISVCLKGQGTLYFMSSLKEHPQAQRPQTSFSDGFTCASINGPGYVALTAN